MDSPSGRAPRGKLSEITHCLVENNKPEGKQNTSPARSSFRVEAENKSLTALGLDTVQLL